MVFQNYLCSAPDRRGNIAFGYEASGGAGLDARRRRVAELLDLVRMPGYRPDDFQGRAIRPGTRQRVAIATCRRAHRRRC